MSRTQQFSFESQQLLIRSERCAYFEVNQGVCIYLWPIGEASG